MARMKRGYVFICILIVNSVLVSLQGCFPPAPLNETIVTPQTIIDTLDTCETIFRNSYEKYGFEKAFQEVITFLTNDPRILNVEVIGNSCLYEFRNGAQVIFSVEDEESQSLGGTSAICHESAASLKRLPRYLVYSDSFCSAVAPKTKRALLMNGFSDPLDHYLKVKAASMFECIREKLESLSFSCTILQEEEVNLETLKDIDKYGVIVIAGHGSSDKIMYVKGYALLTGHKVCETSLQKYDDDIKQGRVVVQQRVKLEQLLFGRYFLVRPQFFSYYLREMPQSLVVMNSCNSCTSDELYKVFSEKKAAAFVGWSREAHAWDFSFVTALISLLCEGKSLRQARAEVKTEGLCAIELIDCDFYLLGKTILFVNDLGAQHYSIKDFSERGYSTLAELLKAWGYVVVEEDRISFTQNYDVIVFATSWIKRKLEQREVERLINYVQQGGGLLLLGDHGLYVHRDKWNASVNMIGNHFGMQLEENIVCQPTNHLRLLEDPDSGVDIPEIRETAKTHPLFSGVDSFLLDLATTLRVMPPAYPAAWTDLDAWLDVNAKEVGGYMVCKKDPFEVVGRFPVIGVAEVGKGRVVIIGDASLWSNSIINFCDNKRLAQNVFAWLAKIR